MATMLQFRKRYISSLNKLLAVLLLLPWLMLNRAPAQCLTSVNPVGGSNNLLALDRNTLRVISFYRFNYGNRYFEGDKLSDFDLIRSANYNYAGTIAGFGLTEKITLESELGYFINKTQNYNLTPSYMLRGSEIGRASCRERV